MESAKLSKNELINLIYYSLKENNTDEKDIDYQKVEAIIADYLMFCNHFQVAYVRGELDTFKRAACLLVAINRRKLVKDKRLNASIAIDTAYKMCEKPYLNIGENADIPQKLEEIDFKKAFENDIDAYNHYKEMLIDSLVYVNNPPPNYSFDLELFYQAALELKHNPLPPKSDENPEGDFNLEDRKEIGLKRRLLNLFKKPF